MLPKKKSGRKLKRCLSVQGYTIPRKERREMGKYKGVSGLDKKEKKQSFFVEQALRSKTPPSTHYSSVKHVTWNAQNLVGKVSAKFSTTRRVSMTEEIMIKKKDLPAPSKYQKLKAGKTPGCYMQEPSRVSFLEEAMLASLLIPAMNKYKTLEMEKLRSRTPKMQLYPRSREKNPKHGKDSRMAPLKKTDEPGPATFKTAESYEMTQLPRPRL